MSRPILCSEILSGFTQPKRAIALYQGGKIADDMIRKKQKAFVDAQKFVLNPRLVENAFNISLKKPSILLEMLEDMKMPFDNLWIEWDENARQDYMKAYWDKTPHKFKLKDEHPDRVGYHISKFTDVLDDSYFLYESWFYLDNENVASDFGRYINRKFYSPTMCQIIHEELPNFDDELAKVELLDELPKGSRIKDAEHFKVKSLALGSKFLGGWYFLQHCPEKFILNTKVTSSDDQFNHLMKMVNYNKSHEFNCLKEICYRLSIAQSASMHWSVPSWKFKEGYTTEEIQAHESNLVHSTEGDTRFLISLFSLLNQSLHTQEVVKPDDKIIHTKLGKRVPRNEYKVLDIDLSANKVRKVYKTRFQGKGNPKRQHTRRGHYRRLRDIDGTIKRKIWIKSCIAGNADLGIIEKDYNLKS